MWHTHTSIADLWAWASRISFWQLLAWLFLNWYVLVAVVSTHLWFLHLSTYRFRSLSCCNPPLRHLIMGCCSIPVLNCQEWVFECIGHKKQLYFLLVSTMLELQESDLESYYDNDIKCEKLNFMTSYLAEKSRTCLLCFYACMCRYL